ncbi:hypothetical protein CHS0354_039172 [Potamilus streckersoni]|uniref:SMP-LTD domain-containing protein n=1 Tax=Potamilus streckersoni TaxID=2493646 RepID=A0AAE0S7F9_9BIVA|nr:hypothetical protein CHS0354_039172 [Potamilus streckersoni]
MSVKKNPNPPPRPPAPRLTEKAFSFRSLEEEVEEQEDLTISATTVTKKKEHTAAISSIDNKTSHLTDAKATDVEQSPLKSKWERTFTDFKEKIQDTISKKIDEFSSDHSKKESSSPLRELKKESSSNSICNPEEQKARTLGDTVIPDKTADAETVSCPGDLCFEFKDLQSIDEYYSVEPVEDFTGSPNLPQDSYVRKRQPFSKEEKIKPTSLPKVAMSASVNKYHKGEITSIESHPRTVKKGEESTYNGNEVSPSQAAFGKLNANHLPVRRLVAGGLVTFLYIVLPLPSFLNGMIIGLVLASLGWLVYLWLIQPTPPMVTIPEVTFEDLPPLPAPELREPKSEDGVYKGWLNEVSDYNPDTYSINQTYSIHVLLDGTNLRLRRPKVNIPRRAMWDETQPAHQFIHQRYFSLKGSKILLLPPGLVKKRLWSKKYPICVILARKETIHHFATNGSTDSEHGFELIDEQNCESSVLYLFARTNREKEDWFRRLDAAARGSPLKNHILEIKRILSSRPIQNHKRSCSLDSISKYKQDSSESTSSGTPSPSTENETFISNQQDLTDFATYMGRLMPRDGRDSHSSSPVHSVNRGSKELGNREGIQGKETLSMPRGIICDPQLAWLNALLGRCFWDFLRNQTWADKVKEKLQNKLLKIHIPFIIEELKVTAIDLGSEVPVIRRANKPYLDETGFWVDLDVTYSGKFKMTIETKINLMKLKRKPFRDANETNEPIRSRSAVVNSDEEDSAESSTDEEDDPVQTTEEGSGAQSGGASKKIMKYIGKITQSKYFEKATEMKYIKKAMEGVSNTPLELTVELQKLNGTLAVNIPPPPSDRLWYGFRGNPQLWLVARPKVGEREVTVSHITEWIEKKLTQEFQHVLVMPNMDDIIIPILTPGILASHVPDVVLPKGSEVTSREGLLC